MRYNAHLAAVAGVLLKKTTLPEGFRGCWPRPVIPEPAIEDTDWGGRGGSGGLGSGVRGGFAVEVFRPGVGLPQAAGGGARSNGTTVPGGWFVTACVSRYAL